MAKYRVRVEFDLTVEDMDAIQARAHPGFEALIAESGGNIVSPFVNTPQQAADYAAQNPAMALSMVVKDIVVDGATHVLPLGTVLSHIKIQHDMNGPISEQLD